MSEPPECCPNRPLGLPETVGTLESGVHGAALNLADHSVTIATMIRVGDKAVLHLNGKPVGAVVVRGADASWSYGEFQPDDGFGEFAGLFGQWSLLMHAEDGEQRISEAASEELRETEYAIDALRAKLFFPDRNLWHSIAQLNIDGSLVEWKEY